MNNDTYFSLPQTLFHEFDESKKSSSDFLLTVQYCPYCTAPLWLGWFNIFISSDKDVRWSQLFLSLTQKHNKCRYKQLTI